VRDSDDPEPVDPGEPVWVTRVQRKLVRDRDGGDDCVECACGGLAAPPQRGCDLAESARLGGAEWKRVEVRLGLLEVRLLLRSTCHEWPDGTFGQHHRGDQRLVRQHGGIVEPPEQDQRARESASERRVDRDVYVRHAFPKTVYHI
jgi:hypothetical protein